MGQAIYSQWQSEAQTEPVVASTQQPVTAETRTVHEYDDPTPADLMLKFLREHRREEFTYNQVKDALGVLDYKQAGRVLQNMAKRGDDVAHYGRKTKKWDKVELFKFSPYRQALDRDCSKAEAVVSDAILEFLVVSQIKLLGRLLSWLLRLSLATTAAAAT